MPDDLRIPMPLSTGGRGPVATSYRARRAAPEPGLRAVTIGALALAGLAATGFGGWTLMARRPSVIPVIEADSRPLRVRPENAGGMQVVGADELVLGGLGEANEKMAPTAEAPAPQALRAQMLQAAAPVPAPAPASATDVPAASAGPAVTAPPLTATALPAPLLAPDPAPHPSSVARAAPVRPGPVTGTLVQLAALDTEAGAQAEWQRLARRMPELLSDRRPTIQKAERDGHAIWRVRTGGFADVAEATGFCSKLRAKGGNCTLADF